MRFETARLVIRSFEARDAAGMLRVFGDPEVWVQQTGSPWFFTTIRRNAGRIEGAVRRAMDAVVDTITGS